MSEELPALHITDINNMRLLLADSYRTNKYLQEQIDHLRNKRFWWFNEQEHWLWDSGGNNYLDSLVCPVIISADDMREIKSRSLQLVEKCNLLQDTWDTDHIISLCEDIETTKNKLLLCFKDTHQD